MSGRESVPEIELDRIILTSAPSLPGSMIAHLTDKIIASDWLASILAAERERIAQAIEAELTDSQEAAETTLAGAWQYQAGLTRALTIARNSP